jgi:hypothetical protein
MSSSSEFGGRASDHRPFWQRLLHRRRATPPGPPSPDSPPGFDWQWYLESYTDLEPAGITDEAGAIRHWREFGRQEGRRFAPRQSSGFDWLSYVDRFPDHPPPEGPDKAQPPRLVCPSVDSVFLRAWGDLVCWDDAGAERVLQSWDPTANYADVFLRGPYEEVRHSTATGRMAWAEECEGCLLLRVMPPGNETDTWDRSFVRMLRVEPSYLCSLDCPGCVPLAIRRLSRKTPQLDPMILDRIIADLCRAGLTVENLDFQGHGEPLLNPDLWTMIEQARRRLPATWITVTTNAQATFKAEMVSSGVDEIVCSVDGCDPDTYTPYRVRGNFDLAWNFMVDLARAARASRPGLRVVWKYVLFEHNASAQALRRAQQMALEAGVTELVFVLTRNGSPPEHIRSPADIEPLNPGPRVGYRFHHSSPHDLVRRLDLAAKLEDDGRQAEAETMARSVRKAVERFSLEEPQIL